MAIAPSSDNIILGAGELLWAPIVSGVRAAYQHLGNCNKFAVTLNDDVFKLNTSQHADRGLLKAVTRSREVAIEIVSNEYGIENLALQIMGNTDLLTQSATTVTATLTTNVQKGRFYKLANRNVSSITSITQGTVTWTVTTDYTLHDSSAGLVRVASAGSNVTTATTAVIIYVAATASLSVVYGAVKTKQEGSLLFLPDPTTGPQYDVEVYRASMTPGGDLDFIGDEFGDYTLSLLALNDATGDFGGSSASPYFRLIQRGTAA